MTMSDKYIDRHVHSSCSDGTLTPTQLVAYAAEKGLHWGFVRDKDNQLYINNTEFAIDMADDHWQPIASVF